MLTWKIHAHTNTHTSLQKLGFTLLHNKSKCYWLRSHPISPRPPCHLTFHVPKGEDKPGQGSTDPLGNPDTRSHQPQTLKTDITQTDSQSLSYINREAWRTRLSLRQPHLSDIGGATGSSFCQLNDVIWRVRKMKEREREEQRETDTARAREDNKHSL